MSCGSVHSTVVVVLGMFSEIRHNKCLTTASLDMMTRLLLNNTFELQLRTPGGTAPVHQNFIAKYPGQILAQDQLTPTLILSLAYMNSAQCLIPHLVPQACSWHLKVGFELPGQVS